MDPDRCKDKQFVVVPEIHHAETLFACLRLMEKRLKKNICNLDDYDALEIKGFSTRQKDCIGDALEYACKLWTRHLLGIPSDSSHTGEVQKAVDKFFTVNLLHWIEVLALTGNLDVGVHSMNDIEQWYNLVSAIQSIQ